MTDFDNIFDYANALVYIDQCMDLANSRMIAFENEYNSLCGVGNACMDIVSTQMSDCLFKKEMSARQCNCWANMKSEIIYVSNLDANAKSDLLDFYNASNLTIKYPLMLRLPKNVKMGLVEDAANITQEIQASNGMAEILTNAILNKYPAMCGIGRIGHKL